jgi:hypothetical protein
MSARLTDQQRRDRAELESHLREHANEVANMLGFTWVWVGPLRTSHGWKTPTYGPLGKGWPDTTYIHARTGRTIYVEFKKELGKTTPDQDEVHRILRAAGLVVLVIRPSSFDWLVEALR